jgi:hypothetical protein
VTGIFRRLSHSVEDARPARAEPGRAVSSRRAGS